MYNYSLRGINMSQLDAFLELSTTEENGKNILESFELLTELGINEHETKVALILSDLDEVDVGDNLLKIYNILRDELLDLSKRFSIIIDGTAPLEIVTKIISALNILPNYGDIDAISSILQEEQSSHNSLCDLISLIEDIQWEDAAVYITDVSDSLLDTIRVTIQSLEEVDEPRDIDFILKRVRKFRDRHDPRLFNEALRDGVRLGTPFKAVLEQFEEAMFDFESLPEGLGLELWGLVLMSDLEDKELVPMAVSLCEDFAVDINVVSKATAYVTKLSQEV